ncbi:hypothetical protein AGMMS4952_18330 [Spirochaetia bacterium]|nr:hypothetical protein AGMMS4952_18330 [Spirochaetia bacterium]
MRNITLALLTAFMFSSCVGVVQEILIRRDGSGTVSLEYRFSRELETLGKLDGNENWPPLPVGKADFERTVARIPGLSLHSFTTKTAGQDIVNQVKLSFSSTEALVHLLNGSAGGSGQRASLVREGNRNRLTLGWSGGGDTDPELLSLLGAAMEGYILEFGLTLPQTPELRILDGNGRARETPPAGTVTVQGKRAGFSVPMAGLLSSPEPFTLEILW